MALTPDEILNHEFPRKGAKAYVAKDVDIFLDSVNNDYRNLIAKYDQVSTQNSQLQARINQLEGQRDEVNQSIIVAQDAANRLRTETDAEVKWQLTHAQEAATKIISDARTKADMESERLAHENTDLVNEQNHLRSQVADFRATFLAIIEQQKQLLESQQLDAAVSLLPTDTLSKKVLNHDSNPVPASQSETPAPKSESEATTAEASQPAESHSEAPADSEAQEAAVPTEPAEPAATDQQPADPTVVVFPENEK
ncbi:DivIVA domain-containing protein [Lactobacillaceae bacterium L1_55_11]|nr:DivIVA domain-containing protein [Lactobacillaceae bacterium L1_55_11]